MRHLEVLVGPAEVAAQRDSAPGAAAAASICCSVAPSTRPAAIVATACARAASTCTNASLRACAASRGSQAVFCARGASRGHWPSYVAARCRKDAYSDVVNSNPCTTTSERRVRNWLRCNDDASSSSPAPAVTASGRAMRLTSMLAQASVPSPASVRTYSEVVASSAALPLPHTCRVPSRNATSLALSTNTRNSSSAPRYMRVT